jgi:hypothetical protein
LPLHPDGGVPLLGEGRGVEDEHRVGAAQGGSDLAIQFVHQRLVVPGGRAEVVLKRLTVEVVAIGEGLGVLVLDVGEESGEIGLGMLLALGAGERGNEGLGEDLQASDRTAEGRGWDLTVGEQEVLA